MSTLQEAIQAEHEGKVVLADWGGRRVKINQFIQNQNTRKWAAKFSHDDFPQAKWTDLNGSEQFIIRGEYGRYR